MRAHDYSGRSRSRLAVANWRIVESTSWVDAVRKGISLGGDSDTVAAIAGSIAAPFYGGVPADIRTEVEARLPTSIRTIVADFVSAFPSAG